MIFAPFLVALAWAAILVVVSYPVYEWLAKRWGRKGAALASYRAVDADSDRPDAARHGRISFARPSTQSRSVQLGVQAGHYSWVTNLWTRLQQRFPNAIPADFTDLLLHNYARAGGGVCGGNGSGTVLRHTAEFMFHLSVTILAMFYLYRDGDSIVARLRAVAAVRAGTPRPHDSPNARSDFRERDVESCSRSWRHGVLGGIAFGMAGVQAPDFLGRDDGLLFARSRRWLRV